MKTKVSGIRAASTSRPRPAYLAIAPEPGTIPAAVDTDSPEQRAYRAGRIDALASTIDIARQALANLDRLEAMELEELDEIAQIASAMAHSKRNARPALSLVEPDTNDYGVAYLAAAAVNAAAASPALETAIAADYQAAGQPGIVLSFTRAVAEQSALTEGGVA